MAGNTIITTIGDLTTDPETHFTPSGVVVAFLTVASTPRIFDRQTDEWRDRETLFMRCSIQRDAAEDAAKSLTKGTRVIVQGRLIQRSYAAREGENRTVMEMQVDEVDPSLCYTKTQVTHQSRDGDQGSSGGGQGGPQDGGLGGDQDGQSGYNQGSPQQGGYNGGDGFGGQGQSGYSVSAGGAADDPWAADGSTSFSGEPSF